MVEIGTGKAGSRFLKTDYPFEKGIDLGTTKLKDDYYLIPEDKSNIKANDKVGI